VIALIAPKTTSAKIDPRKTVSRTPCHPMKAPTIAIIFTSPKPSALSTPASSRRSGLVAFTSSVPPFPTPHIPKNPTAAPTSDGIHSIPPGAKASTTPSTAPPIENSSGMM